MPESGIELREKADEVMNEEAETETWVPDGFNADEIRAEEQARIDAIKAREYELRATAAEFMGMTPEEWEETMMTTARKYGTGGSKKDADKLICLCGHGVTRHTVSYGAVLCQPSRMVCPCKRVQPVLRVSDTRPFMRKSRGNGPAHALSLGIQGLLAKTTKPAQTKRGPLPFWEVPPEEHFIEWIVEQRCDRCKKEGPVKPAMLTLDRLRLTNEPITGIDVLLCTSCYIELS